jgi:hypothetical protein
MSKHSEKILQRNSEISLSDGRTPEREALAEAIALRDEASAQSATLTQARSRAASDRFAAIRDVENCERALTNARETSRSVLVDAFIAGESIDDSAVADAETALSRAQRRLADLTTIADELDAHQRPPGSSVPASRVTEAVRAVVKTHPTVRRLVQDFDTARRTFREYEATLIFLVNQRCVPEDLITAAPSASSVRYADPDPSWVAAIEALKQDPDTELPE